MLVASLLVAGIASAAPAAAGAADVVVNFDGPPASAGQSANQVYSSSPGLILGGELPHPPGGQIRPGRTCGTVVAAAGSASSPPNVASLRCGGTAEFPDPPSLLGTFTTATRTRVSLRVGDTGSGGHKMELLAYDGGGKLIDKSGSLAIAKSGTTLSVAGGQPEIAYFLLDETGSATAGGVWVDDITFDTPPVAGKPSFQVARTGAGTTVLQQGAPDKTVDISLYRVNGSNGRVGFEVTGLPRGVRSEIVPSVNGVGIKLTAGPKADVTPGSDIDVAVTATPQDAGAGTTVRQILFPLRVGPAIELTSRGVGSAPLPTCAPISLDYSVAAHAGPARWVIANLPPGVKATVNGVAIGSAPPVTGQGTASLELDQTGPLAANASIVVKLVGQGFVSFTDGVGNYEGDTNLLLKPARLRSVTPAVVRTPRELAPGTTVTLSGEDLCNTSTTLVRFGNDEALAPARSAGSGTITAVVPRKATSGRVQVIPDAVYHRGARIDGPRIVVDSYRNTVGFAFKNYKPNLTVDQMTAAFGYETTHYTPNICGFFTFGLVSCKVGTPLPDPWARAVLTVANVTMGGGDGGACFGFSRTSQQLRRGARSLRGLGNDAAVNAFTLDRRAGAGGGIQEAINSNQLTQLSNEYLGYYATQAVGNALSQDYRSLRREIEGFLRKGDDPTLSLRDGGSATRLHAVTAYDIENDPQVPGGYYIFVYDSNAPFRQPGTAPFQFSDGKPIPDEEGEDGLAHSFFADRSRIRVRPDGFWTLPSTGLSASSLANIIVSGSDMPPAKPTLISGKNALKDGLTLLLGWSLSGVLRGADPGEATTPPSAHVTQVESGGRRLYSAPGVIDTDPKTALRATPWAPSTGGNADPEGYLLAAGPGASYRVDLRGDRSGEQTRTVFGNDMLAQVTMPARPGVTDQLAVAPRDDEVGFASGGGDRPLDVQMMVRAPDGSTRSVQATTTSAAKGNDSIAFDPARNGVRLTHKGPPATVNLTLSATGRTSLPEAVQTRVRVGRNAITMLKPDSWKRLGKSRLTVSSKGSVKRVALRRTGGKGARLRRLVVAGGGKAKSRIARVGVSVPPSVTAGTATVTFALRRGKRTIATKSMGAGGPGTRTLTWPLPAKARRGDRLAAIATTLLQSGTISNSSTSTRETLLRP